MLYTDKGEDIRLIRQITDHISSKGEPRMTVEAIQDTVELELMASSRKNVTQKCITYRNQRSVTREAKTRDVFLEIINIKSNNITHENMNMNTDTPAGMMMKFSSETTKPFVDDYLLSEEVKETISNNYLHIHDKDYYSTKNLTCVRYPLDRILKYELFAGHGESRPAKRIETASILDCVSLETAQNKMHDGQAISAFDFYLTPCVRNSFVKEVKTLEDSCGQDFSHLYSKPIDDYLIQTLDGLSGDERVMQHAANHTVSRVHQSMETFIHNMNTVHPHGGNQAVFGSINYGADISAESRYIIRELLRSTYRGVSNGETAIFPIQIWKKKRGVNYLPEDHNYDLYQLVCKVTTHCFFPNLLDLDVTFNQGESWKADDPQRHIHEVTAMECRTHVFEDRFGPKTSIGRSNLSFPTINIVRLTIECMQVENKEERIALFFTELDHILEFTARQLYECMKFQRTTYAKQFPLSMSPLWLGSGKLKPNDSIASVISQGTLDIGFIGLTECLVAPTGKHHSEDEDSQTLGIRIVTYIRDHTSQFFGQYQRNYSILVTPAGGLSGKFTGESRKQLGSLPGVMDRGYYTNSDHVPVYYKCSARHKTEVGVPYHDLTRGGHTFYAEMDGGATHDPEAIMRAMDMMDKYNIGYGSVNRSHNRCLDYGCENSIPNLEACPKCDSKHLDKLQHITGYLVGTTDRWDNAKLSKLNDRVTHN